MKDQHIYHLKRFRNEYSLYQSGIRDAVDHAISVLESNEEKKPQKKDYSKFVKRHHNFMVIKGNDRELRFRGDTIVFGKRVDILEETTPDYEECTVADLKVGDVICDSLDKKENSLYDFMVYIGRDASNDFVFQYLNDDDGVLERISSTDWDYNEYKDKKVHRFLRG